MDIGSFAVALKNLEPGWVQFAECHDSAGDLNKHHRLPRMIDPAKPDSPRAKALSLLGNAIALTVPGIPMFLQGLEMHDVDDFSDQKPIPWGQARGPRRGLVAANAALVKLRRNADGYTPGLKGDKLSVLQADNKGKVIVFARYDSKAGTDAPATVVAMNFSGETRRNYSVRLPGKGVKGNQPVWYCLYNSSQPAYDTDFPAEGPKAGTGWRLPSRHAPLPLDLGPWSTVVLSPMGPRDAPVKLAAAAAEEPPGDWTDDDMLDESLDTFVPAPSVEDYVEEIVPPFPYRFLELP
jgi:1,4-alpha-glucan branching enzyme